MISKEKFIEYLERYKELVDIEEKVDYKLIAYIVAAALIAIFLVIINLSGKK